MCFCVLFPDQGADAFALDSLGNVGGLAQIEHEDGQTVVAAEGRGGGVHDGQVIRLVFPAPTEERRKQLTKDVKKQGEEAKTAVRNIRRDAMDKFKAMKKAGEITEDDQKKLEDETQKLTDKYVKLIDDTCTDKNKEIMEV